MATCIVLWAAAFVVTHLPRHRVPRLAWSDSSLHGAGYFVIGTVFLATLAAYGRRRPRRDAMVLIAMMAYAAMDELTQPLAGRSCELIDWVVDVVSVATAIIAFEATALLLARLRRARAA